MSAYATSGDSNWLQLKHQRPSRYGLGCGARDADWDYLDAMPSRCGYTFASEDAPVQLLNNHGGMDEDEDVVRDVWTPYQQMAAAAEEQIEPAEAPDSEMSDSASHSDDMDTEMDVDMDNESAASSGMTQQHFQGSFVAQNMPVASKKKRSFGDIDINAGIGAPFQPQDNPFGNNVKRVRVGA